MVNQVLDVFSISAELSAQGHWYLPILNGKYNTSVYDIIENMTVLNLCVDFKVAEEFCSWLQSNLFEDLVSELMLELRPTIDIDI